MAYSPLLHRADIRFLLTTQGWSSARPCGPEYMRLLRKQVKACGARILDHRPALELLIDERGIVADAKGPHRQSDETWIVHAGSVIIATGGCAFLSNALGCNFLTGDGQLMAAEAGAALSGMEFSNAYGLGPAFGSVTKSLFYRWVTFYDEAGCGIEGAGSSHGRGVIAKTHEGTVRGTGGLHLVDETCATSVEGLYAAGDVATRELICGGFTGGGSYNAACAMSSGFWAGAGAADFAQA